jgi:hypothetical protein
MAIFRFDNDSFKKLDETRFVNEGILERQHLQNALKKQIDVIAPNILVIAEEFSEWSGSNRRIDLLGIDKEANIVVIELKRNETGEHMELQSIRYASMVSTLTFKRAVEIFNKHLQEINSDKDAEVELLGFLGWDEAREDDFALDVRIVLVSSDFSKELTTSVMWLNERDLDIRCYRLIPYKLDGQILIDVQQIIPLPEAETYQVKIKEQKEERREARKSSKDYTRYSFNGESGLSKRGIVLNVIHEYIKKNPNVSFGQITTDFPSSIRSKLFIPLEEALEIKQRDSNNLSRHFIGDGETIEVEHRIYAVSNQWGAGNIEQFLEYARKVGFDIVEEK